MSTYLTPELVSLIITAVVIPFFVKAIGLGAKALEHKIDNATFSKYLDAANTAVVDAVNSTAQTYVDSLKKAGTFTPEAQTEAFNQAKGKALALMGDDVQGFIDTNFGSLETWLDNKIESFVKSSK